MKEHSLLYGLLFFPLIMKHQRALEYYTIACFLFVTNCDFKLALQHQKLCISVTVSLLPFSLVPIPNAIT